MFYLSDNELHYKISMRKNFSENMRKISTSEGGIRYGNPSITKANSLSWNNQVDCVKCSVLTIKSKKG